MWRHSLLVGVVLLLTACGSSARTTPDSKNALSAKTKPSAHPAKHRPVAKVLVVKKPWRPGQQQKGVAIYFGAYPRETPWQARLAAAPVLDYVVSLGANSVSLSFPFFTDNLYSSRVFRTGSTPSPRMMKAVVLEAQKRRLRVSIRPLLDETNLIGIGWRGSIKPRSLDEWFTSYRRFLSPYLRVAQQTRAAGFVTGVELNSLSNDYQWPSLIKWMRSKYKGKLSYSANWDSLHSLLSNKVDEKGFDTYFSLNLNDNASQSEVSAAWDDWVRRNLASPKKLVLAEVGIAPESRAYQHPWWWGRPGASLNLSIQRRWFTAACSAFRRHKLAGIYFWRVNVGENVKKANWRSVDHGTFVGRPAALAIRRCFR